MSRFPRILPIGDTAITVELGDSIDPEVNARVRALERAVAADPPAGLLEMAPTYRSLFVAYDLRLTDRGALGAQILDRIATPVEAARPGDLRLIPTRYGGEEGPDLASVAEHAGTTEDDAVRLHSEREYTAYMVGFSAGFAYLGEVDERLATRRRSTPRVRVPRGSVAIAGRQTGIYPAPTPGGWNLIGRTTARLFDPDRSPAGLILPGDRVRFQPVAECPEDPGWTPAPHSPARPAVEVLEGGLLTTVQDSGRVGHRRQGVVVSGPMDAPAHCAANALVGNAEDAATLECTVAGPTLRFLAPTTFAVAGGDMGAVLSRSDLGDWELRLGSRVFARPGNVLRFRGRRTGCRTYVAFEGGIDVPRVLGSRSTDLVAGFGGFGGRALRAGDVLGLRASLGGRPSEVPWLPAAPAPTVTVRVVLGPQDDHFDRESLERFLSSTYAATPLSDRLGCRLEGAPLAHGGRPEIVTDAMVFGSIEVPADGQPIVMMADAPTTGGYPKIATVVRADLPLLAQMVPGEGRVRFTTDPAHFPEVAL